MPLVPEFIPLRKEKEMFAVASWRDAPNPQNARAADAAQSNVTSQVNDSDKRNNGSSNDNNGNAAMKDKASTRSSRQRAGRKHKSRGKENVQQLPDVEDFFVHIYLPPPLSVQTMEFDLQLHVTPLKKLDVGPPRHLFPRPPPTTDGSSHSTTIAAATTEASRRVDLSPFRTPAVHAATAGTLEDDAEGSLPPAMSLPPSAVTGAGVGPTESVQRPKDPVVHAEHQLSLLFAEENEANKVCAYIQKRWPLATVTVVSRNRSLLNASLVLKGLPSLNKTELLIEEIERLPHKPSYVRLHRGERGVYRNVLFVKYANREAAEESMLLLERFHIGARPLKVEFKKKFKTADPDELSSAASNGSTAALLQQTVRDLRVSCEHEGFFFKRDDLAKAEIKSLKQLCQSYGLLFEMNEKRVTVKRYLGNTHGHGHGSAYSEKPSPALRPQITPVWAPSTPAPLKPMDFKGIRHWKDIRSHGSALGIMRPHGPDDGGMPFSAGRGRPI